MFKGAALNQGLLAWCGPVQYVICEEYHDKLFKFTTKSVFTKTYILFILIHLILERGVFSIHFCCYDKTQH